MQNLVNIWLGTIQSSPYSQDLAVNDFICSCILNPSLLAGGSTITDQRNRYHMLCIAGSIILRWRYTKTGAALWQMPQQWWKLCRKVVYSMYIKWQYTWFVIYSGFFLSSPLELTFWITYICNTSLALFWVSLWCLIFLQYQMSSFISFTCITQGDVDLHFSLVSLRKTSAVEEETKWASWLYHRCNQSMHLTEGVTVMSLC